jgi:hypothetical protein
MVEGNRRPNPLIDQVIQQRKTNEAKELSEAEAKKMLPDFKVQLGSLITSKVPAPEVITPANFDKFDPRNPDKRKTVLIANIPLEDGTLTTVTISASAYPKAENPDSAKDLDYQVDVEELDRILILEGSEARLQSKAWRQEPITMKPIGTPRKPAWEKRAGAEDIQAYSVLLEDLTQEGVAFKGSTPPIISTDS